MSKKINIITTAAVPWFTGTSINPFFRAIYLVRAGYEVTLYLPWIKIESQGFLFPDGLIFKTELDQKQYIYNWGNNGHPISGLDIIFYPAIYRKSFESIFPICNLKKFIKPSDILILEEPEHLLAFQPLTFFSFRKRRKLKKIIGILHTNVQYLLSFRTPYKSLSKMFFSAVYFYNNFILKKNCDSSIRLSGALPNYQNSVICNVNGVSASYLYPDYLNDQNKPNFKNKAYFIGKLIWEKGFKSLIDLCREAHFYEMDIYGKGKDAQDIMAYSQSQALRFEFLGVLSSPKMKLSEYKVFINASLSEVLCTTTLEALAMSKFVIIPKHPSNEFFYSFSNCLTYENSIDFKKAILYTMNNEPNLNDKNLVALSWEKATERFLALIK